MKKEASNEKRYQDALQTIIDIARGVSPEETTATGHDSDAHDSGADENGPVAVGCSVKQLPQRLWQVAADTASTINPVNAPVAAAMAELALLVSDPLSLTLLTSKYWGPTPRRLTVSFMERQPVALRTRILSHMNAWTKTSCVSFVETATNGHIRISTGPGGYWSYLGTDVLQIPKSRPTMNLQRFSMNTSEAEFRRVVRHETGHTLGFPHEHMRKELVARIDRQKAYEYFMRTQGWDPRTVDQQVLTPLNDATIMGTPPDQTSIMCYPLPGSITRDGQPILGGPDINATDYAFAGRVYPKPGRGSSLSAMSFSSEEWNTDEDVPPGQIEADVRETTMYADSAELVQDFDSNGSHN
ncbi:M12 family metallopeptidase [Hymenobacter elongatus]|uniref:Peptidase M12 n=1 Tax=Hymenobacter elongatus TaxID=877208 RepID=A0A4Z0PNY6_9BACT|nr:M12 family metallopeptidase [Hymenobacter elongatus]TGE18899.1 peptidase M12 [Hymenobacter elongatus]